mgnify:CR=1 FL=1
MAHCFPWIDVEKGIKSSPVYNDFYCRKSVMFDVWQQYSIEIVVVIVGFSVGLYMFDVRYFPTYD